LVWPQDVQASTTGQLTNICILFEYYQFMNFDEFKLRYETYKTIVMGEFQ